MGLLYAAQLAHRMGRISAERVQQHYDVVGSAYELPTSLPSDVAPDELLTLMSRDKKVLTDGGLTFVLDGPDGIEVVSDVPAAVALAALLDVSNPEP